MAAANSDLFRKGGANTVTTLAAPGKALAATSITVGSTTNYPTDTGIVIGIRQVDSDGVLVPGTYSEYNATVTSGTTFSIDAVPVLGSDQVYPAGSTTQVFLPVSSSAHNDLIDGLVVSHDQDGTLKAGAVDNAAVLASNVVETPKIKNANVTATKIDWASTGANAGIWWEELGRTTLSSSSDTITVSSIPARKYLQIRTNYSSVGGTTSAHIRFNNDSGANYAHQYATLGGTSTSTTNDSGVIITGTATLINQYVVVDILNISNKEKLSQFIRTEGNATGAGTAPSSLICIGKWANTSAQINRIDIVNVSGSGDFAIGSELVVLGHN